MKVRASLARMLRSMPVLACIALALPASAEAAPPPLPTLLPSGPFSTKGNQIVDQHGRDVRLACVGWNEVNSHILLEIQTRLMASHGFNCIRFSWVNATMEQNIRQIDFIARAARGCRVAADPG